MTLDLYSEDGIINLMDLFPLLKQGISSKTIMHSVFNLYLVYNNLFVRGCDIILDDIILECIFYDDNDILQKSSFGSLPYYDVFV
jgi:hypothetical protein